MELTNHTPYPALLFRAVIDEERIAAALVVRVTYDIVDRKLVPSADQAWKVSHGSTKCEYGPMDGDDVFYRGGVDLFLWGHARAPRGCAVTRLELSIEVGTSFRKEVLVFGDRAWLRTDQGLVPSAPKPFARMPLTQAHAYGGRVLWDGLEVPFPANPEGKGFYDKEEHAVGQPLPNLEDPEHLVRRWDDRSEPVGLGFCPPQCELRLKNGMELRENGLVRRWLPTLFNAAFPSMILPSAQSGDRVCISGVTESSPLEFEIPPVDLATRLGFGERRIEARPKIDQIGIESDRKRVFLTYRHAFRYRIRSLERRTCALHVESRPSERAERGPRS